ncbi:MAG: hypothetical protein WC975_15220 [Phycisphaerae bacterium]
MVISIDGQKYSQTEVKDQTVGDLLVDIRASLADSGRMIVSIVCDGKVLEPDQISAVLQEAVEKYLEIDFQTAVPRQLARDSLEACREFLLDIEETVRQIVDHLRQAQVQEAMELMGPMFGRLNDSYRGLQGTFQLLKIDPESVELSAGNAGRFMTGLVEKLRQIKLALENKDYVGLTDLFEYELAPTISEWRELNNHLLENLSV